MFATKQAEEGSMISKFFVSTHLLYYLLLLVSMYSNRHLRYTNFMGKIEFLENFPLFFMIFRASLGIAILMYAYPHWISDICMHDCFFFFFCYTSHALHFSIHGNGILFLFFCFPHQNICKIKCWFTFAYKNSLEWWRAIGGWGEKSKNNHAGFMFSLHVQKFNYPVTSARSRENYSVGH